MKKKMVIPKSMLGRRITPSSSNSIYAHKIQTVKLMNEIGEMLESNNSNIISKRNQKIIRSKIDELSMSIS